MMPVVIKKEEGGSQAGKFFFWPSIKEKKALHFMSYAENATTCIPSACVGSKKGRRATSYQKTFSPTAPNQGK